jgi:hypothetical protein
MRMRKTSTAATKVGGRKEAIGPTAATKEIPGHEWKDYFDRFTKRHLRDARPETVTIEYLSPELGGQVETEAAQLQGISYDPKSKALEILIANMDHLVFHPREVWAIEEEDGFLSGVEIVRDDGTKEILTIRRGG